MLHRVLSEMLDARVKRIGRIRVNLGKLAADRTRLSDDETLWHTRGNRVQYGTWRWPPNGRRVVSSPERSMPRPDDLRRATGKPGDKKTGEVPEWLKGTVC